MKSHLLFSTKKALGDGFLEQWTKKAISQGLMEPAPESAWASRPVLVPKYRGASVKGG